jgi:hypothetical protein
MNVLPALAKLALDATRESAAVDCLSEALELIRRETGAVGALVFYGELGEFSGAAANEDATRYSNEALRYLQQRLVQLRVPLAFNLEGDEVRYITRAANKQRRDYVAWLVPAADSWTELLVLRGSWPADAVVPLLEFVESAMPALTIMLERLVGAGRRQRLERQLTTIADSVELLERSSEIIGSVAAAYPTLHGLPAEDVELLSRLARSAVDTLEEVRANRDLLVSELRFVELKELLVMSVQ